MKNITNIKDLKENVQALGKSVKETAQAGDRFGSRYSLYRLSKGITKVVAPIGFGLGFIALFNGCNGGVGEDLNAQADSAFTDRDVVQTQINMAGVEKVSGFYGDKVIDSFSKYDTVNENPNLPVNTIEFSDSTLQNKTYSITEEIY